MASSEDALKLLLVEVGNRLEKPPTSVKELLALLDLVEVYLSRVEQSPSIAILNALSPTLKALVGDELFRHADVDVKVSVASCISEITRITAPEVPYYDDQMKEVFQLIVSSFESLADKSSKSYIKRISILETVAKVRSCVVMLDLECDDLILEMFRHFIKAIRDYHPENVFTSIESIMIRVIEESEEISIDLLFCILDTVKKDNKDVTPVARKLMEKVIQTVADKLIPYIKIAVAAKGLSLADYDEVVNHLCLETSAETVGLPEHTDASVVKLLAGASKPLERSTVTSQTAGEIPAVAVSSIEKLPADCCSVLVSSNGNADAEVDTFSISSTLQDSQASDTDKVSETVTVGPSAAVCDADGAGIETGSKASETINPLTIDDNLDAEKVDEEVSKTVAKAEKIMKKRGRKPKAKKKTPKPKLAGKFSSAVKQGDELAGPHTSSNEVICSSPCHESSNEAVEHSSPKPLKADDVPSKEIEETGKSDEKLDERSKSKKVVSNSENHKSLDVKTSISAVSDLEERTTVLMVDASVVKATASKVDMSAEKIDAPDDAHFKQDTTIRTSDAAKVEVAAPLVDEPMEVESSVGKSPEQLGVPSEDKHAMEDDPSKAKNGVKRLGRGLGKAAVQKRAAQAAVENNNKEATTSQKSALKSVKGEKDLIETPKTTTKRRRVDENKDGNKDYGEELVGSKMKVWWPADKKYYKGVIESFDSAKKKHKVLYADGEVEHLVLKKQRWEVINPDEDSDTESDEETPDAASAKRHKGKDVIEGTSKKRLGRPPSSKSKSDSNKPGRKGAKGEIDSSKEKEKSKGESIKKLGRPRADVSKSAAKSRADEPSSISAGKAKADADKSTEEGAQSSGKSEGVKGQSNSKASSKPEVENNSVKKNGPKAKATKSRSEDTPLIKLSRKSKTREPNKSKSGLAVKDDIPKEASAGKSKDNSPKTDLKASEKAESDSKEIEEASEEQTPSPAKAAGSSKRKALSLDREKKSGKKGRAKK
ncbi:hypothetical protein QQ045_005407 [Rhodiola kirilowii]